MPRKAPPPVDPLIGAGDIAHLLGVSRKHALELLKGGEFGPWSDVGTGTIRATPRVRQSGVDAWIASRQYHSEASA